MEGRSLRVPPESCSCSTHPAHPPPENPVRLLVFGLTGLVILARFVWPLQLPLAAKLAAAAFVLVASQYHEWCRLSSGSVFAPEFPRPLILLFNWALGAMLVLAVLQIALDGGWLIATLVHGGGVSVPDGVRYAMAGVAAVAGAVGVQQAVRVPPLKDVEVAIRGLPLRFDGYTTLAGAPAGHPVILLNHQPGEARRAASLGVQLQLSGHTHGGLIVGIDRLAARANAGFVSGRYEVDEMTLYVNNGTALWPGFAVRLGRPSELTRFTLRAADAG